MVVQALEGARPIWSLNKRYTDYVKLHEQLMPFFKMELSRTGSLNVLPALPSKLVGQTDMELNSRQAQLETYMS